MRALRLKSVLVDAGLQQSDLASHLQISRAAVAQLVNHGQWPKRADRRELQQRINEFLESAGVAVDGVFQKVPPARGNAPEASPTPTDTAEEENPMLTRYVKLTPAARQAFGLTRDPFKDPTCAEDMFLSPRIRYVRESIMDTVKHGGFLAVIGESGAGKSTIYADLMERLQRDEPHVIVIAPYVLAMEDSDKNGKTLRSLHIAEAIVSAVAPLAKPRSSPQARFDQLHQVLRDSSRAGHRHVVVIEEAHALPVPTLNHLKRFIELKDGMRSLLSIVLLGQPELELKLSEKNPAVREVVQRIEMIHLPPLDDTLAAFLKHRFARQGVALENVVDEGGLDALRARLTSADTRGRGASLVYPLAVQNALAAAMNAAAELGAPKVTRDLFGGAS